MNCYLILYYILTINIVKMNFRQRWDQIIYTPLEGDLPDVIHYATLDEEKVPYLRRFISEHNGKFEEETLQDTSRALEGYFKPISSSVLNALLEIENLNLNYAKIKGFDKLAEQGYPKILNDDRLSSYTDIRELFDHFKASNPDALSILVKNRSYFLEDIIKQISKVKLSSDIYLELKNNGYLRNIVPKDLLKPLERSQCSFIVAIPIFDDVEDTEELSYYNYADRTSEDYQVRLLIFKNIKVDWTSELVDFLKVNHLSDFLYTRVLNDLKF